jgi:hypothetical protein
MSEESYKEEHELDYDRIQSQADELKQNDTSSNTANPNQDDNQEKKHG